VNYKIVLKKSFPVLLGAVLGYSYYYFIGCNTGTCPITSNPWISTMYGGLIGLIYIFPLTKKKEQKSESDS